MVTMEFVRFAKLRATEEIGIVKTKGDLEGNL
jgi:hypothetical protein